MADILQFGIGNSARINSEIRQYYDQLDELTLLAIDNEITPRQFEERMQDVVTAALLMAFILGGGSLNDKQGQAYLDEQRQIAYKSISALSVDIYALGKYGERRIGDTATQTQREGLEKLGKRLALWTFALGRLYNRSKLYPSGVTPGIDPKTGVVPAAPLEPSLMWVIDPYKKNCKDCLALNGTVLTASEWKRVGIEPQSPQLQCGGWRCGCVFQQVESPSIGVENVKFSAVAHHMVSHA